MTSIFRTALAASLAVLTMLSGRYATGQEPAAQLQPPQPSHVPEAIEQLYQEINEEAIKEPPQRSWEFKRHVGEPIKVPIRRVDAKTLENRFRATFVLVPPLGKNDDEQSRARYREALKADQSLHETFPKDTVERLIFLGQSHLFPNNVFVSRGPTVSEYHKLQLEVCPVGKRPEQRLVEFLTSRQCDNDVVREVSLESEQNRRWKYTIYAPTEEEAVTRAQAIMQLFDYSVCQPLQLRYLAEGRKALVAARQGHGELPKLFDAIRAEEAKRAVPTEITPDILTQLKAQKVMIAIEMAGLDARVKACNDLLKQVRDDTRPSAAQTSVSDMKVRAEVELIGVKEKLDRINAFIAEGSERVALDERIARLKSNRENLRASIRNYERLASGYAHLVLLYAPMEVGDFTVAPIEWTN